MPFSFAATAALANANRVLSYRSLRYRGDDQAVDLSALNSSDRDVVVDLYRFLSALLPLAGNHADGEGGARIKAFLEREKFRDLVHRARSLGATGDGEPRIGQALHDVRGGALTSVVMHLSSLGVLPFNDETARRIFGSARDQLKIIRSVIHGVDPTANIKDDELKPHTLEQFVSALRGFSGGTDSARVAIDVNCESKGTISERCVENAALDRVAYNLINNAVRNTNNAALSVWLLVVDTNLRIAVTNAVSADQRAVLEDVFANNPASMFGSFTTSESGYGLRIVAELVGLAYGVSSVERLVEDGYIGAKLLDGEFVAWFHWPMSNE